MSHLSYPYLFLSPPSFGASGDTCFVIVAFPVYVFIYNILVYPIIADKFVFCTPDRETVGFALG